MARRARKRIGAAAGGWPGRGRMAYCLPRLETACGVAECRMIYDARAAAALSLFKREGLPVEVLDKLHWRIMPVVSLVRPLALDCGYLFWPATGYWRRPDGSHGGGGKLIEEMRRASSGPDVASESML